MRLTLDRAEAAVAGILSAAALWLHWIHLRSAGALWRDEVNTVGLSTLPHLTDVWRNLQYDSFPLLWVLLLRGIAHTFGAMNDPAFRTTGFLVGLIIVGMLWVNARVFGYRFPLASLCLFGLNPSVITWGDSIRGYGLGISTALLTCALIWRFATSPGRWTFVFATVSAVLSVQTLFYNAASLFAFCAGGVAVAALQRKWRLAGAVILIGAIAAISLLPYWPVIQSTSSWNSLVRIPNYDLSWFTLKLDQAISPAGPYATALWFGCFLLALWAGTREGAMPNRLNLSTEDRQAAVFASVTMATGLIALFLFLKALAYLTQPWYYLILLAVSAVCIDIVSGRLISARPARIARIVAVAGIGTAAVYYGAGAVKVRMTNVDIIVDWLESKTVSGDAIAVSPWYVGLTFGRYYRGAGSWRMLPPLGFSPYHRYDLLQEAMLNVDQAAPAASAISAAEAALKSGHSFYLVGYSESDPKKRYRLPAARLPEDGWKSSMYQSQWESMVLDFLHDHAVSISVYKPDPRVQVNEYEYARVLAATGWR